VYLDGYLKKKTAVKKIIEDINFTKFSTQTIETIQ